MKRRTVLTAGVGVLAGCSAPTKPSRRASAAPGTADLLITGGSILTMDPTQPRVEAVVAAADVITAVGMRSELEPLLAPSGRVVDLNGAVMMPGFVDAHSHFFDRADAVGTDIEGISAYILSQGITTTAECYTHPDLFAALERLASRRHLSVRLSAYLAANNACGEPLGDWWLDYRPTRSRGEMLRIGGVKVYCDGGACHAPAASYAYGDGSHGDLYFTEQSLTDLLRRIDGAGHQAAIHALGDRAVDTTLGAMERVVGGSGNPKRHRIEHSASTRPDLLARHGRVGAVVTIFGAFPTCFVTGQNSAFKYRPPEQYQGWEWPWRQLIDSSPGAHFAWHADFPVFKPGDPINALYGFVTRRQAAADGSVCQPTQVMAAGALTVDEALQLMTTGAAYALFRDDEVGRITPGRYADFVVLSGDPTQTVPAQLRSIEVLMTIVGGTAQWCKAGHEALCPS